jgi:hypothetical protein
MWVAEGARTAVAMLILFTSLSFMVVVARVYTRAVIVKNFGIDDWFMLVAMAASIAFVIVVFLRKAP